MYTKKEAGHFTKDKGFKPYSKGFGITLRLFILILTLLLLMVVSHLISYRQNVTVTRSFENILKEIPHQKAIYEIQTAITDYIMPAHDILITGYPSEHKIAIALEKNVLTAFDYCYELARPIERPFIDKIRKDFDQIRSLSNQIMSSADLSQRKVAGKMMEKMDQLAVSSRDHVQELVKLHDQLMEKSHYDAKEAWRSSHLWMVAIFIMATILGLTIATSISLSILRPLKLLDDSAKLIAGGNLKELLHIQRKGEITSLANSFNQMILSLRHQIRTSKTILEAVADPVFTVDMAMNLTYFSPACEKLSGYTSKEVIGKKCYEIFKSDICEKQCAVKSSAKNGTPTYNVEVQIKTKDQKNIPIMASASSLKDEQGNIMGGCEVFRNISEQKRMLRELKEAEEQLIISEKMAALGRLASCVSHELRNPLAIIQNSAYYLKHKFTDQDAKLHKHLDIIEHEIISSNKIIDELLGFCRTTKSELASNDINKVIELSISRIQLKPNITVEKNLAPELPPVPLDKEQIHQVFVNLISNAEYSMSNNGGKISITTRQNKGMVEIEIRDQGCGIPSADLKKLFDPFFTTKIKGIGLGLAISKSIIQNHRANISVNSVVGEGTSFFISLPVAKEYSKIVS